MTDTLSQTLFILTMALLLDWFVGDPDWIWRRSPHPVVLFGKLILMLDRWLNQPDCPKKIRYKRGGMMIGCMIVAAGFVGVIVHGLLIYIAEIGVLLEIIIVAIFLAQKSLRDHVHAVVNALEQSGLDEGRKVIVHIVGRDCQNLDQTDICKAAIESLSENFSDGIVAPIFWYVLFGLPGIFAYKMINTADSMIGYKSCKYWHFGKMTAKIDDFVNWIPARLSVFLIGLSGLILGGKSTLIAVFNTVLRDSGLHSSPNAGWPEAAMAAAANIALGGRRYYAGKQIAQTMINATGRQRLTPWDIKLAIPM